MSIAGLVQHLRWAEHCWFEVLFLNRGAELNPQFGDGPDDADMLADGVALTELLDSYEQQCATSNATIAGHSLDDIGQHPDFTSAAASLRWMILHMIEETARHIGHIDIIRELLDGNKGYY